jgi:hypothetical protein
VEALGLERAERRLEGGHLALGDLDLGDAGELRGQMGHAALQPVAALRGHRLGQPLDQPRPVRGDEGQDERLRHGPSPLCARSGRPYQGVGGTTSAGRDKIGVFIGRGTVNPVFSALKLGALCRTQSSAHGKAAWMADSTGTWPKIWI